MIREEFLNSKQWESFDYKNISPDQKQLLILIKQMLESIIEIYDCIIEITSRQKEFEYFQK